MRKALFFFAAAPPLFAAPSAALPGFEHVAFPACCDGDTCVFLIAGKPEVVRFRGCGTAEIKARCVEEGRPARAARRCLERHSARAEAIDLRNVGLDE